MWWWDDIDQEGADGRYYLTSEGKARVSYLIWEVRKQNIEWWVKIIGGTLAGLTGLAGTIIGIIAVLRN